MPDQDDKCWQCGRPFRRGMPVLVQMLTEDQAVFVGPDCAKCIARRGSIEAARGNFIPAVIVSSLEEGARVRREYQEQHGENPGLDIEENPYKPNLDIQNLAQEYAQNYDLPPVQETPYVKAEPSLAREIARVFAATPSDPQDALTQQAFAALIQEVRAQWQLVSGFVQIDPYGPNDPNPYQDSPAMMEDIFQNRHLWVFSGGEPHPMMTPEQNWHFRGVHDFFGHAARGFAFGPRGEENAWIEHCKLFTPLARWALSTETRGQNSFVNFGPFSHLPPEQRPYAEQKAILLPVELITQPDFEAAYSAWPQFQTAALLQFVEA